MNLAFSYTRTDDLEYNRRGYTFLGAGYDSEGTEVHVFDSKSFEWSGFNSRWLADGAVT